MNEIDARKSRVYQILFITDGSNEQQVVNMLQDSGDCSFSVRKMVFSPHIATHLSFCKWDAVLWDLSNSTEKDLVELKNLCVGSNSFPVFALVSEGQNQLGKKAIEMGAADYLPTNLLSKEVLQRALGHVIMQHGQKTTVQQLEQRFNDLFDNTSNILFALDLEGGITSLNKAAENILGWSRSEALQINIKSLVAPEYAAVCTEMMRRILNGEPTQHFEIGLIGKYGRKVLLEASCRLIRVEGKKAGVQGIARDVTESRHLSAAPRETVHAGSS